jgi:anti-sigma B factor antagonist/stage II sporulation protein AA (anti-sigma F factor antagonist)
MSEDRILHTETDGRVFLVLPRGEVGGFAGEQVSLEVDDVLGELDEFAAKEVVVDFDNVSFFGSCLLAAIQRVWKHMSRKGGQLVVCNVNDVGREVLHVSRFDELWRIYPTREKAKEALFVETADAEQN